jgi:hypothetical protein
VNRAIRRWDKLLLCCSEDSLTSWWVDSEIEKAFLKEQMLMKARKKKLNVLIPLDLDGYLINGKWSSGKASNVLSRLAADFRGWKRKDQVFEKQVENVTRALRRGRYARERPPASRF